MTQQPRQTGNENLASSLASSFETLDLGKPWSVPDEDTCLAHLRLLSAFEKLKNEIGYKDGLWDIWDDRARSSGNLIDVLAKLREKRWAVYVARAIDRYDAWWNSLGPEMLQEDEMTLESEARPERYERFVETKPVSWKASMLPPLDVLLVWHAHQLNPRIFLEDCIRYGYGHLWVAGMPWELINDEITEKVAYTASQECKVAWSKRSGRDWDNVCDPLNKNIRCPVCNEDVLIPWTTCGLKKGYDGDRKPGLTGEGYGDGQLSQRCDDCNAEITLESLKWQRFKTDIQAMVDEDQVLPGTILHLETGLPSLVTGDYDDRLFPSRLLVEHVLPELKAKTGALNVTQPSMTLVESLVDDVSGRDERDSSKGLKVSHAARMCTKSVLRRYSQSLNAASVDLIGAVLRQGVFTTQITKVFHSNSKDLSKAIHRYVQFVNLHLDTEKELAPTLDIDLVWHTHQLIPQSYLNYTRKQTGRFLDHSDMLSEDLLGRAFERTCRVYMQKYGQPYSECACRYCSSVRFMGKAGMRTIIDSAKEAKGLGLQDSQRCAHLSAHPAVRVNKARTQYLNNEPRHLDEVLDAHVEFQNHRLSTHKSPMYLSSTSQRGGDTVDIWGKTVEVESPASSVLAATITPMFYGTSPGSVIEDADVS